MKRYEIAVIIVALFGIMVMSFFVGVITGSTFPSNRVKVPAYQVSEIVDDIAATRAALDALIERVYALEQARNDMRGE